METIGWLSTLPPALAIALAIATRQVHLSLFLGIWLGWSLLPGADPVSGLGAAIEACVAVFADAGNTRVILFSALVGALIAFTRDSGGVTAFADWVTSRGRVRTRRRAMIMSWILGVVVFVESSVTSLVNGAVSRPVFDRLRISRAKLAYLCDSTAAPVCILIPLNAWGAYLIQLLETPDGARPIDMLVAATPLNFYAVFALLGALAVALGARDLGPMATAERQTRESGPADAPALDDEAPAGSGRAALRLVLPVAVMVLMMPVGLLVTGDGDLMAGSGSTSVLWAVLAGTAVAAAMYLRADRARGIADATEVFFRGCAELLPLAALMVLAFAIGATTKAVGTGPYVADIVSATIPGALLPATLFIVAGAIAFATGTSWGTFAIMIPIALALGPESGGPLVIAAVLGGGVFGDHCSPISDTTVVASMAAGVDHIEHVNTQLPYALIAGALATAAYLVAGALA